MSDIDLIQYSFAAGEISPTLFGRVDLAKYRSGVELMRDWFVDYRGGATTRPGTRFVGRTKYRDSATRLVGFRFSSSQTSVLEFGDEYMRVIIDGGYVVESAKTITSISEASPPVVNSTAHGYATGDWVELTGIVGTMEFLNGKTVEVGTTTANTFALLDLDGTPLTTVGFTYTSGGEARRIFTLTTPYAAEDLALLKFTQSADTVTITHVDYATRDLVRLAADDWTLTTVVFGSSATAPVISGITEAPAGTGTSYTYAVTAVVNGDESLPDKETLTDAINITTTSGSITVTWGAVTDADHYNVYRTIPATNSAVVPTGAMLGFIGTSTSTTFVDSNIVPDFSTPPPTNVNPFDNDNYPGVSTYFQQRKVYAGSTQYPQTLWGSKPGQFKNFDVGLPVQAGDAYEFTLASQQLNDIKHMIAMPGGLVILTGGGAWQLSGSGSANSPVNAINAIATPQAYNGCNDVPPIAINYDLLYIQQKGSIVRDLAYNLFANVYTGIDLSVLSNHLFTGRQITEWAYAEEPFKLIWCVLDDGRALSLTFLKEQEVYGWAQHSTRGQFKSVTTVQEGLEDAVYWVVRRFINGDWVQYVERMQPRNIEVVEDTWAVDCGLEYPLVYPDAVLTPGAAEGTAVTFTASASVWSSGSVGDVIRGGGGRAVITNYVSPTEVVANIKQPITYVLRQDDANTPLAIASGDWSCTTPTSTVTGLDHLEGETVAILADGGVQPTKVVTNGSITLSNPASKIVVGLPFKPRLKTLAVDTGEPTTQSKRKKVNAVVARVNKTRGLKVGRTFETLTEIKERSTQNYGQPIELISSDERLIVDPLWDEPGSFCFEQSYPLPASILATIAEIDLGDTKEARRR